MLIYGIKYGGKMIKDLPIDKVTVTIIPERKWYFVSYNYSYDPNLHRWLEDNFGSGVCENAKWKYTLSGFIFENKEDAALFKIFWQK